jgi:hypothetical protein
MISESLSAKEAEVLNGFRLRGLGEASMRETLSDSVIAFVITSLVVSIEVPKRFDELLTATGRLPRIQRSITNKVEFNHAWR